MHRRGVPVLVPLLRRLLSRRRPGGLVAATGPPIRPPILSASLPPDPAAGGTAAAAGLWRTTGPTIVRAAPRETAAILAQLPTGAALRPVRVEESWSRVRGRAGAVDYDGFVRTGSIVRTNR